MIYILIYNNFNNYYYFNHISHSSKKDKIKKTFPWKNTDSAMFFQYSCTFSSLSTQRPLRQMVLPASRVHCILLTEELLFH